MEKGNVFDGCAARATARPRSGGTFMWAKCRRGWLWGAGLGLAMLSGCQTWVPEAALTLPSPWYLQHFPQYIPPSPPFPLTNELQSLEAAAAQQAANPPRPMLGPGGLP